MLINRMTEKSDSDEKQVLDINNNSQEHETTNLTTGDLVILYENMELHDASEISNKTPNQYVETVVHNDDLDSEVSDLSEIYSNEDIGNIFMVNNERIDLLNSTPYFETTLCHKYGIVDMETANLADEFDKKFRFYNPYFNAQLNIHGMSRCKYSDSTIIPASLLDYICCKRLEDNYNFYMDNIIKYVQKTIEQLKRISNGDYLTDRAKEKWREVNHDHQADDDYKNTALISCASIPVVVEGKVNGQKSTWDDIVHSEMDVRCLTKILEKRIIIEVPKVLCGTYKLFSRCCDDNLIISCKKEKQLTEFQPKDDSRVNVLLKLKRSNSGKVTTNINSVMVLKTKPCDELKSESSSNNMAVKIIEITPGKEQTTEATEKEKHLNDIDVKQSTSENSVGTLQQAFKENCETQNKHDTDDNIESLTTSADSNLCLITLDELGYTMRQLNVQSPVLEESEDTYIKKKRSPTRVRIKSPYENRSHVIEEKKRKKLLEIREKREKKKNAMNESHKITKTKYGKAAIMAHSSNSVTKLSITNKSFYNSIYGQTLNINNKNIKKTLTRQKRDNISSIDLDYDEEYNKDVMLTPNINSQKYINRSYYLDDADTEVENLQKKLDGIQDETKEALSPSSSTLSNDFGNLSILKRLITSGTDLSCTDTTSSLQQNIGLQVNEDNTNDFLKPMQSTNVVVPNNTPKQIEHEVKNYKKIVTIECRKSIDKIYDLIKEKGDIESNNNCIYNENRIKDSFTDVGKDSFITQGSDSGTSIKHQLTSSNPSSFSFEKANTVNHISNNTLKRNFTKHTTVTPKVIINSKTQAHELNNIVKNDATRKDTNKIINNPLKAISQLIHDIDNVQKTRHKSGNDLKSSKKLESLNSEMNTPRPLTYKKQCRNDNEANTPRHKVQKERRLLNVTNDTIKQSPRLPTEKPGNRYNRKNMIDIVDEVKELKGEAVRGPSTRSRLDSLAQPKKLYVQAHHEEYQNRHGKHYLTERQKLTTNQLSNRVKLIPTIANRQKRTTETSTALTKQTINGPSLEKSFKVKVEHRGSNEDHEKKLPMYPKRPPILNKTIPTPEPLNKKMVAVETYVNTHFGRILPSLILGVKQKTRAPLVPSNIDLDKIAESIESSLPAEESTTLGNKLHYMINSLNNTNTKLATPTDCEESITKSDRNDTVNEFDKDIVKKDEISASDYSVDVFEDKKIVTAVACISKDSESNEIDKDKIKNVLKGQADGSENEVQKLQNALCNQISNGTFQKRLRIKKLTLTPKHSKQQVIVLNSGDANSLLIKSTMSQKINFSKTDMTELKLLSILSKTSINRSLPLQVSTIGYAFPIYNEMTNLTKHETVLFQDKTLDINSVHKLIGKENLCDKKILCNMCMKNDSELRNVSELTKHKDVSTRCDSFECLSESIENDVGKLRKVTENKEECKDGDSVNLTDNHENISNSTSLDILVGLLNEIKKITSCQANIVNYSNEMSAIPLNKEFEVIHNNVSIPDSTPDISINNSISMSSLISLKHEEYKNCSLIKNLVDDAHLNFDTTVPKKLKLRNLRPLFLDKEVTVKMSEMHIVHTFTDVPSRFFSTTVNTSTEFINSLKIIKKSSSRSMSSLYDCGILHYNSSFHKIKESPKFNQKVLLLSETTNKNERNEIKRYNALTKNLMEHKKTISEFDPMMKRKRDILVTVYSVLVLTVFTALAFPDLLPLL